LLNRTRFLSLALLILSACFAFAEGTRTWQQSRFDELVKGTPRGVAILSSGGLQLAPALKTMYTSPSTYIWSIAADKGGNIFAAAGAPARVYRIGPDGQSTVIFEPQELQVQALLVDKTGVLYAATAPDGKVYRIAQTSLPGTKVAGTSATSESSAKTPPEEKSKPLQDSSWSASVYFDPGTKYIWDLAEDNAGDLYVATGDHGEIYRVTPRGEHSVFFKSDEVHIRVLAIDAKGNVIAGSDGSGLVYRISPDGSAFVLYSAPKKEITALAIDRNGNIYAAGTGEKRGGGAPPIQLALAPQSQAGSQPGSGPSGPPSTNAPVLGSFPAPGLNATGGSEIYRIAPDGSPTRIWTSREDLVYALAFDTHGTLIAGTGNRGHVFAVTGEDDFSDLLRVGATQITGFANAPNGGLYISTSNFGKVFLLGPAPDSEGTYESDVFDAHIFSRWGRLEFRGAGSVDLFARSGNVDNPDRNWSAWTKVDMLKDPLVKVPPARFVQWKAVLHAGNIAPKVESVLLNYLPKNVAPDIDDVSVQIGTRYQVVPKPAGDNGQHFDNPPPAAHDRDAIGVKWTAHDDNDDQLVYSVYYRADGQSRWLLLKDNLGDHYYSFDASLLPDGGYSVKVIASDAPSHSPSEALTAEKESSRFIVDTTPPQVQGLNAVIDGNQLRVTFRAADNFSPIKRAEYSVDAGDWQFVEPVGQLSDSRMEAYDFRVAVPRTSADSAANGAQDPAGDPPDPPVSPTVRTGSREHVIVVRVYDRYDNMVAAKTMIVGNR